MFPVSAPKSSSRFRGRTTIAVSTPLKVSERRRVDEKEALTSTAVWTPIRLAVVPDISSEPYPDRQCTGSVGPLNTKIYAAFMKYHSFSATVTEAQSPSIPALQWTAQHVMSLALNIKMILICFIYLLNDTVSTIYCILLNGSIEK
jgi:hypothetical protein